LDDVEADGKALAIFNNKYKDHKLIKALIKIIGYKHSLIKLKIKISST
jgi:hypothetical protein